MYALNVFFILLPFTFGLQSGQMDSSEKLQCQCTCTPVGVPDKTIYTSGNMNVVNTKSQPNINSSPYKNVSNMAVPAVEGSKYPINKTITQYNDVAVSKVRHSLGSITGQGSGHIIKEENKPKIKWLHSASSKGAINSQIKKESTLKVPKDVVDVASGSMMRNKDTSINEVNSNKPIVSKHMSTLLVTQKDIIQDATKTQIVKINKTQNEVTATKNKPSGLGNQQPKEIKDHIEPTITNTPTTVLKDQPISSYSLNNNDHVASDIGFVLDGSAPNPILSSVMSGVGGSLGSGYIVENIAPIPHSKQDKAHFVEKKAILKDGSASSLVKQSKVQNDLSLTKDASTQTTGSSTVNNNQIRKGNEPSQSNSNNKSNSNTLSQKNSGKNQNYKNNNNSSIVKISINNKTNNRGIQNNNNNRGIQNNNNKQNPNNKKSTWDNKGREWKKNNRQFNQDKQSNRKPWQNKNPQNGGNRNKWNKQQLKPFQIQTDNKLGLWNNNNNNWGNNNWAPMTTDNPALSFGMIGMDPLLFLGQHHLK